MGLCVSPKGNDELPKPLLTAMIEALIYAFIAGMLIGSGFIAGVREGLLFTAALTVAALAICLVALTLLQQAGSARKRVMFFLLGLTVLILSGAGSGATLLWGRSAVDLDLLYAFGMAVILLWGFEALIEAKEDESPIHTLFFSFIGTMVFMFLAGWFARAHSDHPGRPATTTNSPYNRNPVVALGINTEKAAVVILVGSSGSHEKTTSLLTRQNPSWKK